MANSLTLRVVNAPTVARRLRSYDEAVRSDIRTLVASTADEQHARTYDLCPKDTFRMAESIRTEFSAGGYAYSMGWRESDFTGAGLAFYPLFQELGFRHWRSGKFIQNPSLFPAWREVQPRFERELKRILQRQARKRGGK